MWCGVVQAEVKPELLDAILTVAGGDMRKAVTTLQSVHHFYGKVRHTTHSTHRMTQG
jgi:DNA polymerase III delta prime subunit